MKKKKYAIYKKNHKKMNYLIIFLALIILSFGAGYALFSESLFINGNVTGDARFKVYFMSAQLSDASKGTVAINTEEGADKVTYNVNLDFPGDKCAITTKIKNDSSMAVKLKNFLVTRTPNSADIKISYVSLNTNTEILQAGGICTYRFVVYWDQNSQIENPKDVTFEIKLNYEQDTTTPYYEPDHYHKEPSQSKLKINYIDGNGNKLAESYERITETGTSYSVRSPVINGYKTANDIISGDLTNDFETNVIYYEENSNLEFRQISADSYSVVGIGSCTSKNIIIPEEYNGKKVTQINASAFRNNTNIESVIIPENIKSIGQYSFSGCSNLKKVVIYSENLEGIGDENFLGCNNLEEFIVDEDNQTYKAIDGILFSKDETKIIRYPQGKKGDEYTIPSTVTEVCLRAIDQNQYLKKLVIPDNVESIGNYAVAALPKLEALIINARTINGTSVFCDNYYCTTLEIGNNVQEINGTQGVFRKLGQKLSTPVTIKYDGTKAEWNSITKNSSWKQDSKIKYVECTDGILTI